MVRRGARGPLTGQHRYGARRLAPVPGALLTTAGRPRRPSHAVACWAWALTSSRDPDALPACEPGARRDVPAHRFRGRSALHCFDGLAERCDVEALGADAPVEVRV